MFTQPYPPRKIFRPHTGNTNLRFVLYLCNLGHFPAVHVENSSNFQSGFKDVLKIGGYVDLVSRSR